MAVIDQADAVVLVSRGELEDIAHLRERLRGLQGSLHLGSIDATPDRHRHGRPGERHPRPRRRRAAAGLGRPARARRSASSPRTRKAADALRTESGRNIRRSVLVRSLVDLAGAHQRPDHPDRPHPSDGEVGLTMDQQLLRDLRKEVAESLSRPASRGRRQRPADDDLRGRAPVRPRRHRPGPRGPRRAARSPPAARRRGHARRPSSPRASTPRCTASAGCSRCSTTPRSRTSTSTAATTSSSATPTARRSGFPPVAESDEELVELVQVLGAYSGRSPAARSTPPTRSSTCGCPTAAGCRR